MAWNDIMNDMKQALMECHKDHEKVMIYNRYMKINHLLGKEKLEIRNRLVNEISATLLRNCPHFDMLSMSNYIDLKNLELEKENTQKDISVLMNHLQQQLLQLDVLTIQKVLKDSLYERSFFSEIVALFSLIMIEFHLLPYIDGIYPLLFFSFLEGVFGIEMRYKAKFNQRSSTLFDQMKQELGEMVFCPLRQNWFDPKYEITHQIHEICDTMTELQVQKSFLQCIQEFTKENIHFPTLTEKDVQDWLFLMIEKQYNRTDLGTMIEEDAWKKEIPVREKNFMKKIV